MKRALVGLVVAMLSTTVAKNGALSPMDPACFDDFYRSEHARSARRMALITGSTAAAEDVVHEAMIEVYRRWSVLDRPGAYLHRCCVNGALRWLSQSGREAVDRSEDAAASGADQPLVEVLAQLDVLTPRQRTAIVLRYFEDLTEREIADAMRCRPGSVGPLLTRAKATLRKEWTP